MAANINKLRNPDFSEGRAGPIRWVWSSTFKQAKWRRGPLGDGDDGPGIAIVSDRAGGTAMWSQTGVCSPGTIYRIEVDVTCDLSPADGASPGTAGLFLSVQPLKDDRPVGEARVTPALSRSSDVVTIRTYYEAPEGIRRLRISIGLADASGTARIHEARFIHILNPDEVAHPIAIPAPAHKLLPPRRAKTVCVCTEEQDRRIVHRLVGVFGEPNVETRSPRGFRTATLNADAVFLPDADPPATLRTVAGLIKMAKERIVVISLPAMAKLSGGKLSLRRIEQADDPIHARVVFANHATHGFALHDTFAFAWRGRKPGSCVQNQYRKSLDLKAFCKKHGFVTLLDSMCDREATSEQPICLYKETSGGGLYVVDVEPVEASASTWGEPTLAMHLVMTFLGWSQTGLGQFIAPVRHEVELRKMIREMSERFEPFNVQEDDVPVDEVTDQLVTISEDNVVSDVGPLVQLSTHGGRAGIRPWIFVRDGLHRGDVESTHASLLWFKQLVRMEPYTCPYAKELLSQFRLAWIPHVAAWETRDGWRRSGNPIGDTTILDTDGPCMGALIDLVSCGTNQVRVVFPASNGTYRRYAKWLAQLHAAFGSHAHSTYGVSDGDGYADRDRYEWRFVEHDVQVVVDADLFTDSVHKSVLEVGGDVLRIEVPGGDADFVANSIQRMDLSATLLEHVVGLQFGLIAVNRGPTTVTFDGFAPVATGDALIVDRTDPALRTRASQAG